jgi:hypothetical protein
MATQLRVLMFIALLCLAACDCADDDDSSSGQTDNNDDDSDSIDDDADEDDDNDSIDNDATDDDDDNDATDDDDDNDDGDDNDNDDNDNDNTSAPLSIELVAGGAPGLTGLDLALDSEGVASLVAASARRVFYYRQSGLYWTKEAVSTGLASEPSLAIDSTGNPHVAYWSYDAPGLALAVRTGKSWSTEILDAGAGRWPSIAIDSADAVHLTYRDETAGSLEYATNASGQWASDTVDDAGDTGWYSKLAIDVDGVAHAVYFTAPWGPLRYASNATGEWAAEYLDPSGQPEQPGLALDAAGRPWVFHGTTIAVREQGQWETVYYQIASTSPGHSLAIDAAGYVHGLYNWTSVYPYNLTYVTNRTGEWTESYIDGADVNRLFCKIAVDAQGQIHGAYHQQQPGVLQFVTGLNFAASWALDTVDDAGAAGMASEVAVDAAGEPRLVYTQQGIGATPVRYAARTGEGWTDEPVGDDAPWNSEPALTLLLSGEPRIAYVSKVGNSGVLRYAERNGGVWTSETLGEIIGGPSSVRLAAADATVHLAYRETDGVLTRAWGDTGGWQTEPLTRPLVNADTVMMGLPPLGRPVFGYITWRSVGYLHEKPTVHFSWYDGGAWRDEVAVHEREAPGYPADYNYFVAMALDAQGEPHFGEVQEAGVRHIWRAYGDWKSEFVEETDLLREIAIAVDAAGGVHLAYYRYGDYDVRYATNRSGEWVVRRIDSAGDVGFNPSITVGPDDIVRISYYGEGGLWLAEFPAALAAPSP